MKEQEKSPSMAWSLRPEVADRLPQLVEIITRTELYRSGYITSLVGSTMPVTESEIRGLEVPLRSHQT